MQQPVQVTFRDIPHSKEVEQHILEEADKLNQFANNIISCHVVIEQTQKHQNNGKLHNTRVRVAIPGNELATNQNEEENLYLSIRKAFDHIIRQIKSSVEKMHGEVKTHSDLLDGTIVRLFDYDGFGFIQTQDGSEYYFNADNLVNPKFEHLKVGMNVHFKPAIGNEGPLAHRVSLHPRKQ